MDRQLISALEELLSMPYRLDRLDQKMTYIILHLRHLEEMIAAQGEAGPEIDPKKVAELLARSKELRAQLAAITAKNEANVPASKSGTPPQG